MAGRLADWAASVVFTVFVAQLFIASSSLLDLATRAGIAEAIAAGIPDWFDVGVGDFDVALSVTRRRSSSRRHWIDWR